MTRSARAEYTYTPEWPYYDTRKRAVYEGWYESSTSVEFRNVPDKDGDLGDPTWETIDILAIGEIWNILEDAIEEKCKAEDAERRRVAAETPSSPPRRPRGWRQH